MKIFKSGIMVYILSVGYNTWNFYAYYGLNSFFKENTLLEGEQIELQSFQLGLMFYIL